MEFASNKREADVIAVIDDVNPSGKRVTTETCLWHDLHISGDDAAELLEEIAKRYHVTFQDFPFRDYFPNETEGGVLGVLF